MRAWPVLPCSLSWGVGVAGVLLSSRYARCAVLTSSIEWRNRPTMMNSGGRPGRRQHVRRRRRLLSCNRPTTRLSWRSFLPVTDLYSLPPSLLCFGSLEGLWKGVGRGRIGSMSLNATCRERSNSSSPAFVPNPSQHAQELRKLKKKMDGQPQANCLLTALWISSSCSFLLYMHVHVTLFTLPLLSLASSNSPCSPTTAATTVSAVWAGSNSCSCALWTALIATASSCILVEMCIHASISFPLRLAWSFNEIGFHTHPANQITRLLQRADRHSPRTPHVRGHVRLQLQGDQLLHHRI